MSRAAYEAYFRQAAPAGAFFGVDASWYQGYSRGVLVGYWSDFGAWADFVCIRTSFGGSGDDGAQGDHFAMADEIGYQGSMGTYHFATAGPGVQANFDNYVRSSDPFVDRTSFDMLDYEAAPNVGAGGIDELCDRVEQRRQRPCNPYSGKGYLDAAGEIICPASKFWVAHYPGRSADAWSPTTDWASNGAPLMPYQYGAVYPGCWQWQSMTPQHGSLDLNMTTTPESFGLAADEGDGFLAGLPFEQQVDLQQKIDTLFAQFGNAKYYEPGFAQSVGMRLGHRMDLTDEGRLYDFRNLYNNAASNHEMLTVLAATIATMARKLDALGPGGPLGTIDVDKLAAALAPRLDIEAKVARAVALLFADLLGAAQLPS